MLKRLASFFVVLILATALAAASAWWMIVKGPQRHTIANGPWRTNVTVGSVGADMYTRASIALTGLFALSAAEAIYFVATIDGDGQPLRAHCVYEIEGKPVAARWWSITAYADDLFLIPNPVNRFSFNMGNLQTAAGSIFRITAAPTVQSGNWLPTGTGEGGFSLLFRIYNGAPETIAHLDSIALPSIKPIGTCA